MTGTPVRLDLSTPTRGPRGKPPQHFVDLTPEERVRMEQVLADTFASLPPPPPGALLVGVAGTVTTLYAVRHGVEPYDAERVHGGSLTLAELSQLTDTFWRLPLAERRALPGLQPKRADVILAGACVVASVMDALGADRLTVSDRGLRHGVLATRFGVTQTASEVSR